MDLPYVKKEKKKASASFKHFQGFYFFLEFDVLKIKYMKC